MKIKKILFCLLAALLVMLSGCLEKSADVGEKAMKSQSASRLSPEEQEKAAYVIFNQIRELSDSPERQKNIPQMKELYREIIERYPKSGLARESYLRLVMIAKKEGTASGDAEAERLYQEFINKYPDSNMRRFLEYEVKAEKP